MSRYIDEHRGRFGVEPICRVLDASASAYYHRATGKRSERVVDDEQLISDRVWRTRTQLELAIVEWVAWFNNDRLHESLDDLPPAEFETLSMSGTVDLLIS